MIEILTGVTSDTRARVRMFLVHTCASVLTDNTVTVIDLNVTVASRESFVTDTDDRAVEDGAVTVVTGRVAWAICWLWKNRGELLCGRVHTIFNLFLLTSISIKEATFHILFITADELFKMSY